MAMLLQINREILKLMSFKTVKLQNREVLGISHSLQLFTVFSVAVAIAFSNFIALEGVDYRFSSFVVFLVLLQIYGSFGLISVPSFVFSCMFIPSFAFLWRDIRGADYINYHNHWLQDSYASVNESVAFVAVTICLSYVLLSVFGKRYLRKAPKEIPIRCTGLVPVVYFLSIFLSLFFFWLTDPSFSTIFNTTYAEILAMRFEGTQYAGAVASMSWAFAFCIYDRRKTAGKMDGLGYLKGRNSLDKLFIFASLIAMLWLALHARRSELIGVGLLFLLVTQDIKGRNRALGFALFIMLILVGIEELRNYVASVARVQGPSFSPGYTVSSLPGGASNIFMTLVNTVHFFSFNDYLIGETFYNYLFQLLPSNLLRTFNVDSPPFFYQAVFDNYSYNGGTYLGAVFYGNFGWTGVIFWSWFIWFYVLFCKFCSSSRLLMLRALGVFLVIFIFRAFWYELIVIIKPVLVVFFPLVLFEYIIRMHSSERRYKGKCKESHSLGPYLSE